MSEETGTLDRLTNLINSQRLREFIRNNHESLADMDSETINLVFQLETAHELLEQKIKLMYIKEYYGDAK